MRGNHFQLLIHIINKIVDDGVIGVFANVGYCVQRLEGTLVGDEGFGHDGIGILWTRPCSLEINVALLEHMFRSRP